MRLFSLTVLILTQLAYGASLEQGYYASGEREGLEVVVAGIDKIIDVNRKQATVTRTDELLHFGVRPITNEDCLVGWPRKSDYKCRVQLVDDQGRLVKKTKEGRLWGAKYEEFTLATTFIVRQHVKRDEQPRWVLFRTDQLFRVIRSGKYTLRVEFQVAKLTCNGLGQPPQIVRFPSLEIPLYKPDE